MKHLGDITKIDGTKIEPVHCITFGSPCQGLSQAGLRKGLADERSGLFMEAVRVIKEMRSIEHDDGTGNLVRFPHFAIWENVQGSFGSPGKKNKGEDFRCVLEELARIADPTVTIPRPPKGKWEHAGVIAGDRWSIAWRLLDAQFWGVPQRRKRIALVVDLDGQRAPEILFERTRGEGNLEPNIVPWKGIARNPQGSTGEYDLAGQPRVLKIRGGREGGGKGALIGIDKSFTLSTLQNQTLFQPCNWDGSQIAQTLTRKNADGSERMPDKNNFNAVLQPYAVDCRNGKINTVNGTLQAKGNGGSSLNLNNVVCYGISAFDSNAMKSPNPHSGIYEAETSRTLDLNGGNPACNQGGICVCERDPFWIARRLMPIECSRLQGYPDGWVDIGEWVDSRGKKHKDVDSQKFRAFGNSLALPQWWWLVNKMKKFLPEVAKLGSLFDGIGGFPLVWEETYGKGTARWASEIEEFPIAVTKLRFPEEEQT